jgi:predicted ATPase
VRRCTVDRGRADPDRWPYTLPAVAQLFDEGLVLDPGVTVLLGENGTGKSTIVEAIATAWGRRTAVFRDDVAMRIVSGASDEDSDLDRALRLESTRGGGTAGFFLRAERFHQQAPALATSRRWRDRLGDVPLLQQSHGEGFLAVLAGMAHEVGLYVLDEPESALSFTSSLALLQILEDIRAGGSQVVLATHSPILAALPDACLLQLDQGGIHRVSYDECELTRNWRLFLDDPRRYTRHLKDT